MISPPVQIVLWLFSAIMIVAMVLVFIAYRNRQKFYRGYLDCTKCGKVKHLNEFATPDLCSGCYSREEIERIRSNDQRPPA